jgi:hypothetical protein
MRLSAFASLLCAALFSTPALADDDGAATRAAGWAVLGIGASLGMGSVTSGAMLTGELSPTDKVGTATLVGGLVTTALGLIIGIPLIASSGGDSKKHGDAEYYADALSGAIRW